MCLVLFWPLGKCIKFKFVARLPTRYEFLVSCLRLLENCKRGLECSVVLYRSFKLTLNDYWHSLEVSTAWRQRSIKAGLVEQSLKQGCALRCGKLQLYFRGGRFPNSSRHPWGGLCRGGLPASKNSCTSQCKHAQTTAAVIQVLYKHSRLFIVQWTIGGGGEWVRRGKGGSLACLCLPSTLSPC